MVKVTQSALIWALIAQLSLMPFGSHARSEAPPKSKNQLLTLVLDQLNVKYERLLKVVPQDKLKALGLEKKTRVAEEFGKRINALKSGALSASDLQKELIEQNRTSVENQKRELYYQIRNLKPEVLDKMAEAVAGSGDYQGFYQEYESSYTQREKADAVAKAVARDLDFLASLNQKRVHNLDATDLAKDLKKTNDLLNTKGKTNWLLLVAVAGATIALTGLVSWGIATAVYDGRYQSVKNSLDKEFDQLRAELETRHNDLYNRMNEDEMTYLRENGFAHTVCGTYKQPDSIICNGYDYRVFAGDLLCNVSCWMNAVDGRQTLHEPPSCTAPFIPAGCYDPSEYDQGFSDGYSDGYDPGYWDGANDGEEDGADAGYDDGYYDGDEDGYDTGYSDGFEDGYYDEMYYETVPLSSASYMRGFNDGKGDARILKAIGQ